MRKRRRRKGKKASLMSYVYVAGKESEGRTHPWYVVRSVDRTLILSAESMSCMG